MRVVVVTPPPPVVSLGEAKAQVRVEGGNDDALLTALVAAAQGHIDGPAGWLGRAIGLQTLEARWDGFGAGELRLPFPPVVSLTSIKYIDAGGAETTLAPERYLLLGDIVGPAWGTALPASRREREAVRVRYQAGYVANDVPAPIKAAILLMVGDLYAFRETAVSGPTATAVPMSATVEALLAPYRVWG